MSRQLLKEDGAIAHSGVALIEMAAEVRRYDTLRWTVALDCFQRSKWRFRSMLNASPAAADDYRPLEKWPDIYVCQAAVFSVSESQRDYAVALRRVL